MIEVRTEEYNNHNIAVSHHDAKSKSIVIFCHGYRGTAVGPRCFFVRAAQKFEEAGISSIRFDQYGSGNSDGDFFNSNFDDWLATTKAIANNYLNKGYKVALFGQSMGGSTVISVGSELSELTAVVAWVPDPNIEEFIYPESGYIEEGGQRVQAAFWQQAHDARVADKLVRLKAPAFIVQCTDDEYVDTANRKAISDNAQPNHKVVDYVGYNHSSWTYDQAEEIITKSTDFVIELFNQ
ncbi:alpha/beta fold hydrolase [Candidatus Saccharibacteria bacterium]|nr:MAG: alpha/beta fold hydrolase [Candidatus Saccharibacteria bacterium]